MIRSLVINGKQHLLTFLVRRYLDHFHHHNILRSLVIFWRSCGNPQPQEDKAANGDAVEDEGDDEEDAREGVKELAENERRDQRDSGADEGVEGGDAVRQLQVALGEGVHAGSDGGKAVS